MRTLRACRHFFSLFIYLELGLDKVMVSVEKLGWVRSERVQSFMVEPIQFLLYSYEHVHFGEMNGKHVK